MGCGSGVIIQLLQTPMQQLFWNPWKVYFQDWLGYQAERWGKPIFWAKIGPRNPVIVQKWYLVNRYCRKLVDPSKWPQEFSYYGCSKIYILLRQVKVPKKCLISFFRHYMMKLWKFPYHENYMPYQIGWPLIFLASDIFCRPCPKFFSITTLYKST